MAITCNPGHVTQDFEIQAWVKHNIAPKMDAFCIETSLG